MKRLIGFFVAACIRVQFAAATNIGNIELNFCNGSNHLFATMEEGKTTLDICMMVKNSAGTSVDLELGIVDGEIAQGNHPVQACKTSAEGIFGSSVTFVGGSTVTLSAGKTLEKHATLNLPVGFAGDMHGCITYSALARQQGGGTVTVVTRKANLVDITVLGVAKSKFGLIPITGVVSNDSYLENYGTVEAGDNKIKVATDLKNDTLTVMMGLENSGYVDEAYRVTVEHSSRFGAMKKTFTTAVAHLYPQEKTLYVQSLTGINWYEGWVQTNVTLSHGSVTGGIQDISINKNEVYSFSYLLTPWYYFLGCLAVIRAVFRGGLKYVKMYRRKKQEGAIA